MAAMGCGTWPAESSCPRIRINYGIERGANAKLRSLVKKDVFYRPPQCPYSISQMLTFKAIVVSAEISRDGNQKIGNHADRKDRVVTVADKNNQANYDRGCAQYAD